jgi:hypothetical protein
MAKIPQITSISNLHGKTARAVELAIASETLIKSLIKSITPKTITIR